jgi:hypothetical protein
MYRSVAAATKGHDLSQSVARTRQGGDFRIIKALLKKKLLVILLAAIFAGVASRAAAQTAEPYQKVLFFDLANFAYNPAEPGDPTPHTVQNGIPANIKALDGRKVEIWGVVVPLEFEGGQTNEFLLAVTADVCGFGAIPRINEWMHVSMAGGRKIPMYATYSYTPLLRVRGVLHVKEDIEDGRLVGLYDLVADAADALQVNK